MYCIGLTYTYKHHKYGNVLQMKYFEAVATEPPNGAPRVL